VQLNERDIEVVDACF